MRPEAWKGTAERSVSGRVPRCRPSMLNTDSHIHAVNHSVSLEVATPTAGVLVFDVFTMHQASVCV